MFNLSKKNSVCLTWSLLFLLIFSFCACGSSDVSDENREFTLPNGAELTFVREVPRVELDLLFVAERLYLALGNFFSSGNRPPVPSELVVARNSVLQYRMVYTPYADANLDIASDLVIPSNFKFSANVYIPVVDGDTEVSIASLQHFTSYTNQEVVDSLAFRSLLGYLESAQGVMVVVPDYIGFGSSVDLVHPFVIRDAYGLDGASAILSAMELCERFEGDELLSCSNKVGLGGYSEGGYATLAIQRYIEQNENLGINLLASAPGGGPYVLADIAFALLNEENYSVPSNVEMALTLLGYVTFFEELEFTLETTFVDAQQDLITRVLVTDKTLSRNDFQTMLPTQRNNILRSNFVSAVLPSSALDVRTFIENSPLGALVGLNDFLEQVEEWQPTTRTRFFHCEFDDIVNITTVQRLVDAYIAEGVDSDLVDLDVNLDAGPGHLDCPFVFSSYVWLFEELNK